MISLCIKLISTVIGVNIEPSQIAHVELKCFSLSDSPFTKSIFVRFHQLDLRMKIWESKKQAEIGKVIMEEWLTDVRAKLMKKCKKLLTERLIENVKTKEGDIVVIYRFGEESQLVRKVLIFSFSQLLLLGFRQQILYFSAKLYHVLKITQNLSPL